MAKAKREEKLKVTILKDSKKDFTRKGKSGFGVYYPKFRAKAEFYGTEIEFADYDSHKGIGMEFKELCKLPKNRQEYGQDFMTANGQLMIMIFKLDSKGKQVITSIEII